MTSADHERAETPSIPTSSGLSILPGLFFVALALLSSPSLLETFFGRRWQLETIAPGLAWARAFFAAAAAVSVLAHRRIAAFCLRRALTPRRMVGILALALFASGIALGAAEVALRLLHVPFKRSFAHREVRLCRFDEELGWVYRPGLTATQPYGENKITMHFDEMGIRVASPDQPSEPGAPSVLFIGGSFTMGHGLAYEPSFVGQLSAMDDLPYRMVNLGVQAYGTDQALVQLERHFDDFDTRAVVYTFVSAHVKRNAYEDRRMLYPPAHFLGTKPRFALSKRGTLRQVHTPVTLDAYGYSRLAAAARLAWLRYGPELSLDLTHALVDRMRTFVESRGAKFIVVNWIQDSPMSVPLEGGQRPFDGMELDVIDTSIDAPPDWDEWRLPKDGHPDERAHAHVARLLAEKLR